MEYQIDGDNINDMRRKIQECGGKIICLEAKVKSLKDEINSLKAELFATDKTRNYKRNKRVCGGCNVDLECHEVDLVCKECKAIFCFQCSSFIRNSFGCTKCKSEICADCTIMQKNDNIGLCRACNDKQSKPNNNWILILILLVSCFRSTWCLRFACDAFNGTRTFKTQQPLWKNTVHCRLKYKKSPSYLEVYAFVKIYFFLFWYHSNTTQQAEPNSKKQNHGVYLITKKNRIKLMWIWTMLTTQRRIYLRAIYPQIIPLSTNCANHHSQITTATTKQQQQQCLHLICANSKRLRMHYHQ